MPGQPLVLVGEVIKPHGLTGEFSVMAHVDSPDFFTQVPRLYIRRVATERPSRVTILSCRTHKGRPLLRLMQVQGRDQAEELRGAELLARPEDLPGRSENDILVQDLIGMTVRLPSDAELGRIEGVSDNAGQEVWSIQTPGGREVLFPAHQGFVLEVNFAAAYVRIDPPPGLLELYLGEG